MLSGTLVVSIRTATAKAPAPVTALVEGPIDAEASAGTAARGVPTSTLQSSDRATPGCAMSWLTRRVTPLTSPLVAL